MSMDRWNPFRDMEMMRQNMDRWFDDRMPGQAGSTQPLSVAVDLHETENGYELTASMPGMRAEDVDITINRDTVTLRGKSEHNNERQQGNYIYRERHSGSFQRTVRLPEAVNTDQAEATLEHGVLKLSLPRLQQTPSRRLQVRMGGMSQSMGGGMSQSMGSGGMSQSGSSMSAGQTGPNVGATGTSMGSGTGTNSSGMVQVNAGMEGGNTSSNSATPQGMERPAVLNQISSTQMEELDRKLRDNDEAGFRRLAESYAWDKQTCEQVWTFMHHQATGEEARRAFDNQAHGQQPTNSL